jgi:hypothetical protein
MSPWIKEISNKYFAFNIKFSISVKLMDFFPIGPVTATFPK